MDARRGAYRIAVALSPMLALLQGCVSLAEHRDLERRYQEQEVYITGHRDEVARLTNENQTVRLQLTQREEEARLAQEQLAEARAALADREQQVAQLNGAIETARSEQAEAERFDPASIGPQNRETGGFVLDSGVLFSPGSATLSARGREALDPVAARLNSAEMRRFLVRVDGHTDSAPISRSGFADNWDLSGARARAVLTYLATRGVEPARLFFAGFSDTRPISRGTAAADQARNRRVEIVLIDPARAAPPPDLQQQ